MKKYILIASLLFPLALSAQSTQTTQLNFKYNSGTVVGRSTVMDLPVSLFANGTPQGQLLIFKAPTSGKYAPGLFVFSAGDGEQVGLDVTLVNKNSLPRMIAAGLTPYSLIGKDTMYWTVVSIHNNAGSAYRSQLAQILPWILDKAGLLYDPKKVWLSGLSGGGSATWASVMIDPNLAKRITGIIPMANGGYDDQLAKLMANLVAAAKGGVWFFPYIGTQDPGYNASGFFAYNAVLTSYALPDHYHPHVIPGGTHSANVWDVPFNSRVIWDSLGLIGQPSGPPPEPSLPHAVITLDSTVIHWPNTRVYLADSSYSTNGTIVNIQWTQPLGPNAGIWTSLPGRGMLLSGLVPGVYQVKLYAVDSATLAMDTATRYFQVLGPMVPAPRIVTAVQISINGIMIGIPLEGTKITYSDGNP